MAMLVCMYVSVNIKKNPQYEWRGKSTDMKYVSLYISTTFNLFLRRVIVVVVVVILVDGFHIRRKQKKRTGEKRENQRFSNIAVSQWTKTKQQTNYTIHSEMWENRTSTRKEKETPTRTNARTNEGLGWRTRTEHK